MSQTTQRDDRPLPESEDYVVAESSGPDAQELTLAAPDGQTLEEYHQHHTGLPKVDAAPTAPELKEPESSPWRFSLFELLAAMTFVSIALAGTTWLPMETFVGIAGLLAVFFLIVFFVFSQPESRLTKLAWWTLVATYLICASVAILRAVVS